MAITVRFSSHRSVTSEADRQERPIEGLWDPCKSVLIIFNGGMRPCHLSGGTCVVVKSMFIITNFYESWLKITFCVHLFSWNTFMWTERLINAFQQSFCQSSGNTASLGVVLQKNHISDCKTTPRILWDSSLLPKCWPPEWNFNKLKHYRIQSLNLETKIITVIK